MMNTNAKYITTLPTAAVLFCAYIGAVNLPDRNIYPTKKEVHIMATIGTVTATKAPWDDKGNSRYYLNSDDLNVAEQINVIHDFVSLLLRESQDLDPKYSRVVDKYFWDLA